jgi:tetratricopeptide (TPR) repeat protein
LALFLLLGVLSLIAERNPSGPQTIAVVLMGLIAIVWTLPELPESFRRWRKAQDLNQELTGGNQRLESGDYLGARDYFEDCFRRHAETPAFQATALHNSAIACLRLGDFSEARRRFTQVLDSGWPGHWRQQGGLGVRVPNALAWLEVLDGNLGEALRLQNLALSRVPARARTPYRIVDAAIALREHRYPDALRHLEQLSALPSSPQRDAVLGVLWGFALSQQGAELAAERFAAMQQAPGSRKWMGAHWPELAQWMEERGVG